MRKSLRIPLIILAALLVLAGGCSGYFFLCLSAEPPTLYINESTVARCGPVDWNGRFDQVVESVWLDYGPENTVIIPAGDTLTLRTEKTRWWEPGWKKIKGSGYAVFHEEFGSVSAQWTGEDTLPMPAVFGKSIAELWVSYDGWLRFLAGQNRVRYTFAIYAASCQH